MVGMLAGREQLDFISNAEVFVADCTRVLFGKGFEEVAVGQLQRQRVASFDTQARQPRALL